MYTIDDIRAEDLLELARLYEELSGKSP